MLRQRRVAGEYARNSRSDLFPPGRAEIGAQHATSLAVRMLLETGAPVLTEGLTYSGMKALATYQKLRLIGVAIDEEGLVPEALNEACARSGARLLYVVPTLHSPTEATMGARRRSAIAEIVERRGLIAIEDNVDGFLHPAAPPALAELERDLLVLRELIETVPPPAVDRVGTAEGKRASRPRTMLQRSERRGWVLADGVSGDDRSRRPARTMDASDARCGRPTT